MFLYYLQTADGSPLKGKWVAFRDLPGGMFYHQAYQVTAVIALQKRLTIASASLSARRKILAG